MADSVTLLKSLRTNSNFSLPRGLKQLAEYHGCSAAFPFVG